jgi:hypothetical protein
MKVLSGHDSTDHIQFIVLMHLYRSYKSSQSKTMIRRVSRGDGAMRTVDQSRTVNDGAMRERCTASLRAEAKDKEE